MDIIIVISLILLPVILIKLVTLLLKKNKKRIKIVLYLVAFLLVSSLVAWFFIPFSIDIPNYENASIMIYNENTKVGLDENQSTKFISLIDDLTFQRNFFNGKIPYHENDENYYFVHITLKENNEIVFSDVFNFATTPFKAGGLAYDGDMNRIINPSSIIDYIVSVTVSYTE